MSLIQIKQMIQKLPKSMKILLAKLFIALNIIGVGLNIAVNNWLILPACVGFVVLGIDLLWRAEEGNDG